MYVCLSTGMPAKGKELRNYQPITSISLVKGYIIKYKILWSRMLPKDALWVRVVESQFRGTQNVFRVLPGQVFIELSTKKSLARDTARVPNFPLLGWTLMSQERASWIDPTDTLLNDLKTLQNILSFHMYWDSSHTSSIGWKSIFMHIILR